MDQHFRCFGKIPLDVAAEPGPVVENAQGFCFVPAAVDIDHATAFVKVQVPQGVNVSEFIAAHLAGRKSFGGLLLPRRSCIRSLQPAPLLHAPENRGVRRHLPEIGVLGYQRRQVVHMKLATPGRVVPVLALEDLHQPQAHGRCTADVAAGLAPQFPNRVLRSQCLVIPAFNRRGAEA